MRWNLTIKKGDSGSAGLPEQNRVIIEAPKTDIKSDKNWSPTQKTTKIDQKSQNAENDKIDKTQKVTKSDKMENVKSEKMIKMQK